MLDVIELFYLETLQKLCHFHDLVGRQRLLIYRQRANEHFHAPPILLLPHVLDHFQELHQGSPVASLDVKPYLPRLRVRLPSRLQPRLLKV
jgi:hypothetical protein